MVYIKDNTIRGKRWERAQIDKFNQWVIQNNIQMELIAEKGFISFDGMKMKVKNNHKIIVSYSHPD